MRAALMLQELRMPGRVSTKPSPSSRKKEGPGDRLSRFRRERGISQSELAGRVGITQRIMSYYENGRTRIPAEMLLKMADALKISVYEILGRATSSRSPKNKRLWKVLEKLEAMPSHDQKVVLRYIDAVARTGNGRG
jgi:transcriptional regulator with XRE-family HTH domain